MFFIPVLIVTALAIAAVAGFFSIYGLAHIYAATFWSVVVMGTVLEVGKLVAASALQRMWHTLNFWLKTYLMAAVAGLMLITSAGIFGYLSNAYQQDSVNLKDVQVKIELLKTEEQQLSAREQEIDADVNRVGENYVRARIKLMDSYKEEKQWISERRREIRKEVAELSSKQLEVEAHTGPIIYIAKAFDQDVDTAIKWMTLLLIFVFDPLAIALTLVANQALMARQSQLPPSPPAPPSSPLPTSRSEDADVVDFTTEKSEATKGTQIEELPKWPTPAEPTPDLKQEVPQPESAPPTEPEPVVVTKDDLDEPSPSIDSEEKLDKLYDNTQQQMVVPSRRRVQAGSQSDFIRRMIQVHKNS